MNTSKVLSKFTKRAPAKLAIGCNTTNKVDEKKSICTQIIVDIYDDYDITIIDKIIKSNIEIEKSKLNEYKAELNDKKNKLEDVLIIYDYNKLSEEIEALKKNILNIEKNTTYKEYVLETAEILEKYTKYPKNSKKLDIMHKSHDVVMDTEKIETVEEYISYAKKYVRIDIKSVKKPRNFGAHKCTSCNESLNGIITDGSGTGNCLYCGSENKVDRITIIGNREYEDLANFLKTFYRYIGTQTVKFSVDEMTKKLDEYFINKGKLPSSYYKNLPLNSKNKKDGTSTATLLEALKDIGRNDNYEDIMYIGNFYYGWKLDDIMHLESVMTEHYKATQLVWEMKMTPSEKERESSLPTNYRLMKHLQILDVSFDVTNFKLPQQLETIRKYDRMWEIMCNRSQHPDIFFIPT